MHESSQTSGTVVDVQALADKLEIIELIGLERLWRDTGQWDKVASAYTDRAVIKTTWFEGSAKDFAAASKDMAARGRHSKHPIWPIYVRIDGDRALVESRAEIQFRDRIKNVAADLTQYVRFVSRVRRTAEGWKLESFEGIYERGTLAPVNPNEHVPIDWSEVEDASPRSSYQLWAWSHLSRGYSTPDNLLGDDRPDQLRNFYATEERWLHGQDGTD